MYAKPQEGWVIPYSGKPYTSANVQCKLHAHTCFLASTESMQHGSDQGMRLARLRTDSSFGNTLTMVTYSALHSKFGKYTQLCILKGA